MSNCAIVGINWSGEVMAQGVKLTRVYGAKPSTTSSNATAAYSPIGSGLPSAKIDRVAGVVKAYATCVGEGPFVRKRFGAEAELLRQTGAEAHSDDREGYWLSRHLYIGRSGAQRIYQA